MIGGEHKKERFSERLAQAQNQPKHRGYIYGTELMTGGYTTNTLAGNWSEERADAGFYDGKPALPTDQEKYWTTTYRQMVKPAKQSGGQAEFNQETLIEIEDRTKSSYPAHQPHLDPHLQDNLERGRISTFTASYQPPEVLKAAEQAYVPPVLGGVPGAQAYGVLLRLRRQLELQMPGRSAFPGNVTRTVRHALQESTTDVATGEVNIQELQEGLARIGVSASVPECTALVRYYDSLGQGTASLYTIVKELRGKLSDRREQLTKSAYELLVTVCPDGIVRLDRMTELIDVAQLERVKNQEVSEEEARCAFMEQWDARDANAYISLDRFMVFFGDVSFEITGDGAFELMMRNVWHLSGGSGKSANTSCKRVRVVHRNGRITEEEAKNDITIPRGVGPHVEEKIRENLERQGIKDIKTMTILS